MKWKINEDYDGYVGEEFWYDLTCGGYIDLDEILVDEKQKAKLQNAIDLVESFMNTICEEE